jgi:hypothetical protein
MREFMTHVEQQISSLTHQIHSVRDEWKARDQELEALFDSQDRELRSLAGRVVALESGGVASGGGSPDLGAVFEQMRQLWSAVEESRVPPARLSGIEQSLIALRTDLDNVRSSSQPAPRLSATPPSPSPQPAPAAAWAPPPSPSPTPTPVSRQTHAETTKVRPQLSTGSGATVKTELNNVEDPLDGIIAYLTKTKAHGSNVHDAGVVTITARDPLENQPQWAPKKVADFDSPEAYKSKDKREQWLIWDFGEMRVRPIRYTIRSADCLIYLKSWMIEGSIEGGMGKWVKLDERRNYNNLKSRGIIQSFDVQTPAVCRFLRLTLPDRNHSQTNEICLNAFEVFGTLSEPA